MFEQFSLGTAAGAASSYMPSPSSLAIIALVAILSYFVASTFFYGRHTVPLPSYKSGFVGSTEGFTVPERSFLPPPPECYTDQALSILQKFEGRNSTTGEGQRDLVEFKHLLDKLSCFKKDLVSPNYTVDATLNQPYITSHDVEAIAETTGRCLAKTIPPRDLDISMDKWTDRGGILIRRLCTSYSLSTTEAEQMESAFQTFIRDVYDTAREKCLPKEPLIAAKRGPREPSPFSVGNDPQIGEFNGYY